MLTLRLCEPVGASPGLNSAAISLENATIRTENSMLVDHGLATVSTLNVHFILVVNMQPPEGNSDTSRRTPPRFAFNCARCRDSNRARAPPMAKYEHEKTGIVIEDATRMVVFSEKTRNSLKFLQRNSHACPDDVPVQMSNEIR